MQIHEDDRRVLYDWTEGDIKSSKALIVKDDKSEIGAHKHNDRDEEFLLLKGRFIFMQIDQEVMCDIPAPFYIMVKRGVYHSFVCEKESILLCASTAAYDKTDEIK